MIPKIIHYCWFGGNPLPEQAQKCIESWKRHCPDYQIVRWDETNFDLKYNAYVKEAYEAKKWAFVTDVVRLYALVNCGGIYMDTDVEVLKPLDAFLSCEAFSGFETEDKIPTGIMACVPGHPLFAELLHDYDGAHFLDAYGEPILTTNVERITAVCQKHGLRLDNSLQTVMGLTLYPKDYFCPKDYKTHALNLTGNTHTIHHFDGSWMSEEDRLALTLQGSYEKRLPKALAGYAAKFVAVKRVKGFPAAVKFVGNWLCRKRKRKESS